MLAVGPAVLGDGPASTPGCPGQEAPPPVAGEAPVAPLPWPAAPVGGPAMAACGDVGPPGAPAVGAASYALADLDTGNVLAARAPHARQRPASTLKILTALVAVRRLGPETVVDGTADDLRIDGSKAGIGPGGHYTVAQLLAGLLLNSGNDTAEALARAVGGDAAMEAAMAATAAETGALDTRPATPSGLDAPGMAMSAYDLAVLFRVAMREQLFAQTIATRSVPFPGYGTQPGFTLSTNERFLFSYPGAIASKSGFTDDARHTLVAAATRGGRRLIVTLMRGEQTPVSMASQAAALLDWGYALPAGTAPVGQLVDSAPAPPPPAAPPPQAQVAAPQAGDGLPLALAVGGGAVVAAVAAAAIVYALRRRRRG